MAERKNTRGVIHRLPRRPSVIGTDQPAPKVTDRESSNSTFALESRPSTF